MALSGLWSRLTGGIFGVGVGIAAADAMTPVIEPAKQQAWVDNPFRVLDLNTLAALVAQRLVDLPSAAGESERSGFDSNRMNAAAQARLTAPGVGELLTLLRRGDIKAAEFTHGLGKHSLEGQWDGVLAGLKTLRLSPQDVAVMIQRTVIANPGILPNQPDTSGSNVPPMPQISLDPVVEAAAGGIDPERLAGLARIIGLPASPDLAARMHFRNIITAGAFNQAILEGNTRGEWAPFLLEGFREIPTSHTFVQGHLRGWLTQAEMYAGSALHGMSKADTDLLFEVERRPLNPHAITTALARGGHFQPQPGEIADPYQASVHQANLGPEWYDLAVANKYTYPSAFVLRSLAEAGDLGNAQAVEQILLEVGWKPSLAQLVATKWTTPTTGTGTGAAKVDPWVSKANNHLWTAVQKGYIGGSVDQANATQSLDLIGVNTTAQAEVFARWDETRRIEAL